MTARIPFLLYGDGPRLPSGLARIARDLLARLVACEEELGIRVAQVGVDWPGGWHWQSWDFCGFQPTVGDQGRAAVESVVRQLHTEEGLRPIVLMIMDPSRCYDLTRRVEPVDVDDPDEGRLPCEFWGYFPIDAHNQQEMIGGPARFAVWDCQRVQAYGRYGAGVLRKTVDSLTKPDEQKRPITYLPHGIETSVFRPGVGLAHADEGFQAWTQIVPPRAIKLGCVATNQARKDFGLLFTTLAHLKTRGHTVALWLHTDKLTRIWDVGELVRTSGLRPHEVCVSTDEISDLDLAARYGWSDVTIAPALGEGFGYPIVESLACGTPVVHGNYAGGAALVPDRRWLVEPTAWRLESLYAIVRPVFHPGRFAQAVEEAWTQARVHPATMAAYCSGAVSYLDWQHLWPRWRSWITTGLTAYRKDIEHGTRREQQPV